MAVGGSVKMKADRDGDLQDEAACLDSRMREKPARNAFTGACRIIHHLQWQYLPPRPQSGGVVSFTLEPNSSLTAGESFPGS